MLSTERPVKLKWLPVVHRVEEECYGVDMNRGRRSLTSKVLACWVTREKYIFPSGPNEEQPVPDTKLQRLNKTVLQSTPHFRYRVPFWRTKTIATQHKSTMERGRPLGAGPGAQ